MNFDPLHLDPRQTDEDPFNIPLDDMVWSLELQAEKQDDSCINSKSYFTMLKF